MGLTLIFMSAAAFMTPSYKSSSSTIRVHSMSSVLNPSKS
eukprot:CAMPEP_0173320950 /NCGR_PEP_ID=MMETSP1143-20121109/29123_1 /TAXON_ID=483371 /ORGANISM="non described non described, Strain CCMP2298" /LENGTH=39 /DNA_ID= /DNA_START= /DNA_END= /DNA_ORIENTATION=